MRLRVARSDVLRHRGVVMEHRREVYREREGWGFDSRGVASLTISDFVEVLYVRRGVVLRITSGLVSCIRNRWASEGTTYEVLGV